MKKIELKINSEIHGAKTLYYGKCDMAVLATHVIQEIGSIPVTHYHLTLLYRGACLWKMKFNFYPGTILEQIQGGNIEVVAISVADPSVDEMQTLLDQNI